MPHDIYKVQLKIRQRSPVSSPFFRMLPVFLPVSRYFATGSSGDLESLFILIILLEPHHCTVSFCFPVLSILLSSPVIRASWIVLHFPAYHERRNNLTGKSPGWIANIFYSPSRLTVDSCIPISSRRVCQTIWFSNMHCHVQKNLFDALRHRSYHF